MAGRLRAGRDPKTRRITFRVTEAEYVAIEAEAAGNRSQFSRECVLGNVNLPSKDASAVAISRPSRSRKRTVTLAVRLSETEALAVERIANRGGYANRAVLARSRLLSPLGVRIAGELGATVRRIDAAIGANERDVERLYSLLRQLKADLLSAGAVT